MALQKSMCSRPTTPSWTTCTALPRPSPSSGMAYCQKPFMRWKLRSAPQMTHAAILTSARHVPVSFLQTGPFCVLVDNWPKFSYTAVLIPRAKACCVPFIGRESISHAVTCREMHCRGACLSVADSTHGRQHMLYPMAVVASKQHMCAILCSPLLCIASRCRGSQTMWMHGGCWAQSMLRTMMTLRLLLPWLTPSRQTQLMPRLIIASHFQQIIPLSKLCCFGESQMSDLCLMRFKMEHFMRNRLICVSMHGQQWTCTASVES